MLRLFLLICLFATAFQINALAIETLETHHLPRRETADLAQYSPSEMKRIRRAIVAFQTELKRIGYYKGPIDGLYGRGTNAAWVRFAREHGLSTKRLGNFEYGVLKSVADESMTRAKHRVQQRDITDQQIANYARQVLGQNQPLSLTSFFRRNCRLDADGSMPNWRKWEILEDIQKKRKVCDSLSYFATKTIQKLSKNANAIAVEVQDLPVIKIIEDGGPPNKCYKFSGTFGKGSVEYFTKIVQLPELDHIAINFICLEFSGGNVFEAVKFIRNHVRGKFLSKREYVWTSAYGTIVLPKKECGDVCSLIFLSGHRGWIGEGSFRLMHKSSKIVYKSYRPILTKKLYTAEEINSALKAVLQINSELLELSETPFNPTADKYANIADEYILPKELLEKLTAKDDGVYRMPNKAVKLKNKFINRNDFMVFIYE